MYIQIRIYEDKMQKNNLIFSEHKTSENLPEHLKTTFFYNLFKHCVL